MTRRTLLFSAAATADAQQRKKSGTVADEHAALGIDDSAKPAPFTRATHPDAQWFPAAGLGLFIH